MKNKIERADKFRTYASIKIGEVFVSNNPYFGKMMQIHQVGHEYEYSNLKVDPTDVPPYGFCSNCKIDFVCQRDGRVAVSEVMEIEITRFSFDKAVYNNDKCYCEYQFNLDHLSWYCRLDITFEYSSFNYCWVVKDAEIKVWIDEEDVDNDNEIVYIGKISEFTVCLYHNYFHKVRDHILNN